VQPRLDPGAERALRRRPAGWRAPGPAPAGAQGRPELEPGPDEVLSYLTGDWRIFQRRDGHRWSLDDMLTALVAIEAARARGSVRRALDLGCGIGSVLMMVAWALPEAELLGVEAQALSLELARRSVRYNGVEARAELRLGDLRNPAQLPEGPAFDLVTGTPPYIPLGRGLVSSKVQRGPCCFETRGGVEDYCAAAARALLPDGLCVLCAGPWPADRIDRAASDAALAILRRIQVVPRDGKPTLFGVYLLQRAGDEPRAAAEPEHFLVRHENGRLSAAMHRARELLGMPPAREGS
jgi:tRNA1Val (adenine37-N6)-methyltransferase